jgi:uncharacterized protein (DUF2147 family)
MKSMSLPSVVSIIALVALGSPAVAEALTGTWLTEDGSSRIQFQACTPSQCGRIVWLREPIDPATGTAWLDKLNADEALKRRPLLGLSMITEVESVAAGKWTGSLYNPLDGRSYSGTLTEIGNGRLQIKGCAFAGLLCQSETWIRVGQ